MELTLGRAAVFPGSHDQNSGLKEENRSCVFPEIPKSVFLDLTLGGQKDAQTSKQTDKKKGGLVGLPL